MAVVITIDGQFLHNSNTDSLRLRPQMGRGLQVFDGPGEAWQYARREFGNGEEILIFPLLHDEAIEWSENVTQVYGTTRATLIHVRSHGKSLWEVLDHGRTPTTIERYTNLDAALSAYNAMNRGAVPMFVSLTSDVVLDILLNQG